MKFKLLFLFITFSLALQAEEESLIIKQKSGGETVITLSSNPVITFDGETMVLTNDYTCMYIPLDDIDTYETTSQTTEINNVSANTKYTKGHVVFSNIPAGTVAHIHTIDGRLIGKHCADATGNIDINISELPKGIYITSTPAIKFKVTNK